MLRGAQVIADVKGYARARMVALKYVEWSDGFNFKDIPKNSLNKSFHVELTEASGSGNIQDNQDIAVPFTVRIFSAATGDPKAKIDADLARTDTVIAEFVKAANRLTQAVVKTVTFVRMQVEPLDRSNDHGTIIKIEFKALVILSMR